MWAYGMKYRKEMETARMRFLNYMAECVLKDP